MGARFLTALRTEKLSAYGWSLTDDLVFESVRYRGLLIVPRGFQTDLASIPRLLWTVIPKVGDHDAAAVLHDAGYGHALVSAHGDRIHAVKHVADDLFDEAMRADAVAGWRRRLMVAAVRRFGRPDAHPLAAWSPSLTPGPVSA